MERYKSSGRWHLAGLGFGLLAVILDATGLLLTKQAFLEIPSLSPIQANLYRGLGALIGFLLLSKFYRRIFLLQKFLELKTKDRVIVIIASFLGTFLSLVLFMNAVRMGHLSVVSSVAGTGPLFSQIFESLRERKMPHPLWFAAFACMALGFTFF